MPETETIKSEADRDSSVPEPSKPNESDNAGTAPSTGTESATQEQSATAIDKKSTDGTKNEPQDAPTKEISVPEVVTGNSTAKVDETENKAVIETPKNTVEDTKDSKASANGQNEKLPIPEKPQTIGAGDVCLAPKQDENGNTQNSDKKNVVADRVALPTEKLIVDGDKKAGGDEITILKLKQEVQKSSQERDSYQKKLESTEKKLAALQASYDALLKGEGDEVMLRRMVDQLKGKLIQTSLQLEDRIRIVTNQEKQISALNSQVASLKEVESLTRSLLQIRNMEVKHLQAEVDDMEVRINEERDRYNTTINKMDAAVKLNADLKKEYETQLCLFRDLREKYEEKVTLLSEEKRALENSVQAVPK